MAGDLENLGRRVGELRQKLGWTQQELADRLAISRTAVSHFESGMTDPSERTVVLLAGLFKLEPAELVAGTKYPAAKRERLPAVAARFTRVELLIELLHNDLAWLERTGGEFDRTVLDEWESRLLAVHDDDLDTRERELLREARRRVRSRRSAR